MIDITCKVYYLLHLKKLQIIKNTYSLIIQVIFMFSDWKLINTIIVSFNPFSFFGKQIFKKMLPGEISNFPLHRVWWGELGGRFWEERWRQEEKCLDSIHFLGIWTQYEGCTLEAKFEQKLWYSTLFIILWILTSGLRYPHKRGGNRKTVRWNRGWRHLFTLVLEFQ